MTKECIRILDYSTHLRCGKKQHLTPIIFYDPVSLSVETIINCQIHSDEILRPIIGIGSQYQELQNLIEIGKGRRERETIVAKSYEMIKDPEIASELSQLYKVRSDLTNKVCRLPVCERRQHVMYRKRFRIKEVIISGAELDKEVFTVFPFGTNGRNRHKLYFHEECFNKLKRMFGDIDFNKPLNQKMEDYLQA